MKRIDRYVSAEFLTSVLYCLTGFSLLYVIADLFGRLGKILKARPPLLFLGRYYGSVLIEQFGYLAPAALLLGSLYTLWQFSRNNEVLAMRTSGLSMGRVMLPLLVVAAGFAVVGLLIGELLAPRSAAWADDFSRNGFHVLESRPSRNHVYLNAGAHRFWTIAEFDLARPTRLKGVKVTTESQDGRREKDIVADEAEYLDGQWWFRGPRVQRYDAKDNPVGTLTPMSADHDARVEMTYWNETPHDFVDSARRWTHLSALEMYRDLVRRDRRNRDSVGKWFDFHQRLAMPWACVVVTLLGIPAGVGSGRRSAVANVGLALCLFLAFYVLGQMGLFLGKRQVISPWLGAWLSNIVFLTVGLFMAWRWR